MIRISFLFLLFCLFDVSLFFSFVDSRDVQAAMDLCKETLLEIDMTSFVHNICGHVKDFRMRSGVEMLRQQQRHLQQVFLYPIISLLLLSLLL